MLIEHARESDEADIHEVFYRAWLATYPNLAYSITREDIEERFKGRDDPAQRKKRATLYGNPLPREPWLVARLTGKVVGVCTPVQKDDRNQLQRIYVHPLAQGLGVGSALWKKALDHIDKSKDTYVEVVCYNEQAILFYRKHGFVPTGRIWFDDRITFKSGAQFPEMEMVLKAF